MCKGYSYDIDDVIKFVGGGMIGQDYWRWVLKKCQLGDHIYGMIIYIDTETIRT